MDERLLTASIKATIESFSRVDHNFEVTKRALNQNKGSISKLYLIVAGVSVGFYQIFSVQNRKIKELSEKIDDIQAEMRGKNEEIEP